jgi:hypothetical protein
VVAFCSFVTDLNAAPHENNGHPNTPHERNPRQIPVMMYRTVTHDNGGILRQGRDGVFYDIGDTSGE